MDYKMLARELLQITPAPHRKPEFDVNNIAKGEMAVLGYLHSNNREMLASEISADSGISTGRLATVLRVLEGKGQIDRRRDENDRRRVWVSINESGRARLVKQYNMVIEFVSEILEEVGEEDSRELVRIYGKFAQALCKKLNKCK